MSTKTDPLTFKDIAQITGLSIQSVQRNEKNLGLYEARIPVNRRLILFNRNKALAVLKRRGFEVTDNK